MVTCIQQHQFIVFNIWSGLLHGIGSGKHIPVNNHSIEELLEDLFAFDLGKRLVGIIAVTSPPFWANELVPCLGYPLSL